MQAILAAVPYRLSAAEPPVSPLMTTLSGYMASAAERALPEPVIEKTKHIILDTLAAMISGSELPPGKFAINSNPTPDPFRRLYSAAAVSAAAKAPMELPPMQLKR